MTNGEVPEPDDKNSDNSSSKVVFTKEAPKGVNATKSYYKDHIAIRWNSVKGADYYTIEKSSHTTPSPTNSTTWNTIGETIEGNKYEDYAKLEKNTYYSYRVTAHTLQGETGATSAFSTGTILASPLNLDATKGTSETAIIITWDDMPNVESYKIYKATTSSVTGLEGEHVGTVNDNQESSSNLFSYTVSDTEKGSELYFAIKGIGATGEEATISGSRYGFTFVPGAPSTPEVIASKGTDKEAVTLQFKTNGDQEGVDFIIKRSNPGSAETELFNSTVYDKVEDLVKDEAGYYVYTDTNVRENVEYTYSVIVKNDIGMSRAGIATGYLLSPVQSLKLEPVKEANKLGYNIAITLPVGSADGNGYKYLITKRLKNGESSEEVVSEDAIKTYNTFLQVSDTPTKEGELKEIKSVSIIVENKDGLRSDKVDSNSIAMLPESIKSIKATTFDKPLASDVPNDKGVYPVHVTWETDATIDQTIIRSGSDGSLTTFKAGRSSFDDTTTSPLVKYDYYIDTSDELGRTFGSIQHAKDAYAAVTHNVYIEMFESLSLKPWEKQTYVPASYRSYWKKSRIATLVGYGNASDLSTQMKALDSASDKDHFRSDSKITYSAAMEGVGGQIYFTYTNFGEDENYYVTGNYEMHVNSSGTGSAKSNTNGFNVMGMYPGHISLDKIRVESKAFRGIYVFTVNYKDGATGDEVAVK